MEVRQPANREVYEIAKAHGVATYQGDGNDMRSVYSLAEQAIARARHGGGPTFLEFKTYRWREHCGPFYDNDLGYRDPAEFEAWKVKDPLVILERHIREMSLLPDGNLESLKRELTIEIDEAVTFAKNSPFPKSSEMATFTYPA